MENGDEIDVVIEQFGGWTDVYEIYFDYVFNLIDLSWDFYLFSSKLLKKWDK
jgi:hypothetical protein